MAICLELGGVTTEVAIQDLNTALTALITGLLAQGVDTQSIIRTVEDAIQTSNSELKLLNARTEEMGDTGLGMEDIEFNNDDLG